MRYPYTFFVIGILLLTACSKDVTSPIQLKNYTSNHQELVFIQNAGYIRITNNKGGVMVTGSSLNDSIQVNLYKTIEASSNNLAAEHFDDMKATVTILGDTLMVAVDSPLDSDDLVYKHVSLALQIPYQMNCRIRGGQGDVFIDQMSSSLSVENLNFKVQVDHHEGSCDVSIGGDISVNTVLPDTCHCRLNTTQGNVALGIPADANGNVRLETGNGTIAYSGLVFAQVDRNGNVLTGTLGTGAADVSIRTGKGNITVTGL